MATNDKTRSQAVWDASPAGSTYAVGFAPGSREFFEQVYQRRSTYEMPWLYQLVPFARTKNLLCSMPCFRIELV